MRRFARTQCCAVIGLLSLAGAVQAAPVLYSADTAKSVLEFGFEQAGAQNKGRFPKLAVSFNFDADSLPASSLDVTIDVAALDSGDRERDDTLRDVDLLSVKKFPQAHFVAKQITKTAAGYQAAGTLTLRGVARPITVPFALRSASEQGHAVLYMTGKTVVKRLDYGVGEGDWKSTEWVGNSVDVSFNLRLASAS